MNGLARKHVANAIRHIADEERLIAQDFRNALHRFADKLDNAPRATLKPRGKAGVIISIPRAIGETIDHSRSVQIALQQVVFAGTINKLLLDKISQYRDAHQKEMKIGEAESLLIPYHATANRLRTLIREAQAKPDFLDDLLLYPLDLVAEVLYKLGSLEAEAGDQGGGFCSLCFRYAEEDGTTCFLHRHESRGAKRKDYANARRRLGRYRELLAIPRSAHDFEHFILHTSPGQMGQGQNDLWRNWASQFDLHLKNSLPYVHPEIVKSKTLSQCESWEELVREILTALWDNTPLSEFIDVVDPDTGMKGPYPKALLGLLARADLWFRADNELKEAVASRLKIDKEQLITLNQQGLTTMAIAQALGATQQAVSATLQRLGIQPAHKRGRMRQP